MYGITIPKDMSARPLVKKWETKATKEKLGREIRIGVGDSLRFGHHLGITLRALYQYQAPLKRGGLPVAFDELSREARQVKYSHTGVIVGLFLNRKAAEDCRAAIPEGHDGVFDARWLKETKQVLSVIGMEHPLVTIAVIGRDYALPRFLWDKNTLLPFYKLGQVPQES